MERPELLGETFWKLHRNTLIFSSASILLSSHVLSLSTVLSGDLESPPRLTALIAFLAAAYAYAVYFLEAARESSYLVSDEEQRLTRLQEKISNEIKQLNEGSDAIREAITEPINGIKFLLTAGLDANKHPSSIVNPINFSPVVSESIESLKKSIYDFGRQAKELEWPPTSDLEANKYIEFENAFRENVSKELWEIARDIKSFAMNRAIKPIGDQFEQISERLEAALENSRLISVNISSVLEGNKELSKLIKKRKITNIVRIVMLGKTVPSLLFFLAVYHFVAQYLNRMSVFDMAGVIGII